MRWGDTGERYFVGSRLRGRPGRRYRAARSSVSSAWRLNIIGMWTAIDHPIKSSDSSRRRSASISCSYRLHVAETRKAPRPRSPAPPRAGDLRIPLAQAPPARPADRLSILGLLRPEKLAPQRRESVMVRITSRFRSISQSFAPARVRAIICRRAPAVPRLRQHRLFDSRRRHAPRTDIPRGPDGWRRCWRRMGWPGGRCRG